MGGVEVEALVDTGSQTTIISMALLHRVAAKMRMSGRTCLSYRSRVLSSRKKGGGPILITAQVLLTVCLDAKVTTVPFLIQPDSEQDCPLGTNLLSD